MDVVLLILAALDALLFAALLAELALAGRRLERLEDVEPVEEGEMPLVSVVVAARDEARAVEAGMRSLLALEGRVEVVAVDDRSTDGTGEILDRLAADEPRMRVVHLSELPPGWLGKNHALDVGARAARGRWLLFTDADVVMRPSTVRRAVAYVLREGADHLTVAPRVRMPGALLQAFGVVFGLFFVLLVKPWKVADPRSARHIGIGAFNLVRAEAYRAMGTHRAIALRPDDDLKLGKLVKKHGFRQRFLSGAGALEVEWYASLGEMVRGLEKNAFSGVEYRLSLAVLATLANLLVFVWPWIGLWVGPAPARWLCGACALATVLLYAGSAREQRAPVWPALLFPALTLLFLGVFWNAVLRTLARGGIEWRGTRYPLDELRGNRV